MKALTAIGSLVFFITFSALGCGGNVEEIELDKHTAELSATSGWHGYAQLLYVQSRGTVPIVNEFTAMKIPSNTKGVFWWFCGQGATLTAFNFAMGKTPDEPAKKSQLEWIHGKLFGYQWDYNDKVVPGGGPYAARISSLRSLMATEKRSEIVVADLSTTTGTHKDGQSRREAFKYNITKALDGGAYVVALNRLQSDTGPGHFLTVFFIDYQPTKAGGGKVFYGDTYGGTDSSGNPYPNGRIGTPLDFSTFLNRMASQSPNKADYLAFSVKRI